MKCSPAAKFSARSSPAVQWEELLQQSLRPCIRSEFTGSAASTEQQTWWNTNASLTQSPPHTAALSPPPAPNTKQGARVFIPNASPCPLPSQRVDKTPSCRPIAPLNWFQSFKRQDDKSTTSTVPTAATPRPWPTPPLQWSSSSPQTAPRRFPLLHRAQANRPRDLPRHLPHHSRFPTRSAHD
ncbi:MAG: hypothetical protein RIS92_121 [Verrucomicrobiota bacterium]